MEWEAVKDLDRKGIIDLIESHPNRYADYSSMRTYIYEGDYYRKIYEALYDYLGFPLAGFKVLDMGPGSGESLDIARERGAFTYFMDRDLICCRWNQCNEHKMIVMDYGKPEILEHKEKYTLIISRGAFNFDYWENNHYGITFEELIEWVQSHGQIVVITPAWERGEKEPYHSCIGDKLKSVDSMRVVKHLYEKGFKRVEIKGYQKDIHLPISFIWSAKDAY
jgi:hypothetical protein